MTDVSFPEHEYLTVKELADLLRLKERKVYDLAASGAVPCARATGKLLFPAAEIRDWIARSQSGALPVPSAPAVARPNILLGSHDPLLDWALRQSRCGLASFYDGSLDGVARFARHEGIASGMHVLDPATGIWNVPVVSAGIADQNAVLVAFAQRQRGLVFRKDGPVFAALGDLAGARFVPRQAESGSDVLFRNLAERDGLDLAELVLCDVARTEDEAVELVRLGDADATFGLEAVACSHGLGFHPVIEESFALLVDRKAWFEPAMQQLMAFCQSAAFRNRAQVYGGYDISALGTVLWNA
jgi:putative molybdopterin biosynthesis protein